MFVLVLVDLASAGTLNFLSGDGDCKTITRRVLVNGFDIVAILDPKVNASLALASDCLRLEIPVRAFQQCYETFF